MAILFVWSPWYVLSFGLLVLGGAGQAGFGTMQSTITLLSAPPEMRGRMVGLMSVCIGLGTPLGLTPDPQHSGSGTGRAELGA